MNITMIVSYITSYVIFFSEIAEKKNNSLGKKEKEIETAIYSFHFLLFSRIINDHPFIHLQYLTAIDHTRILH